MIFLTVGGQLPFDRLVRMLDEIAPTLGEPIFAQVGKSEIKPVNFDAVKFLKPDEFQERFRNARVVVAHAGIGTILTAKKIGKPVILTPRRAALGEHRNDHQLATVAQLGSIKGVHIAQDAPQLLALLSTGELATPDSELSANRAGLIDFLRGEVLELAQRRYTTS